MFLLNIKPSHFTPSHTVSKIQVIVFIYLFVYIHYYVFNVRKLYSFDLLVFVCMCLYIFHCVFKLF